MRTLESHPHSPSLSNEKSRIEHMSIFKDPFKENVAPKISISMT